MIGKTLEEVNVKAIDFYSIGHIIFGYIAYGISLLCIFFLFRGKYRMFTIIPTLLIAIGWELLENTLLVNYVSIKFEGRADTAVNSQVDVIFTLLGGIISYFVSFLQWVEYFWMSLFLIAIFLLVMEILFKLTYENSK